MISNDDRAHTLFVCAQCSRRQLTILMHFLRNSSSTIHRALLWRYRKLGGLHKQVAWIKADAKAILAIHEHVITNNGRLSVTHNDYNTWTLNIKSVKMEDRGQYMCQVNTDPMKMQTAYLEVVIPPDIVYEEVKLKFPSFSRSNRATEKISHLIKKSN